MQAAQDTYYANDPNPQVVSGQFYGALFTVAGVTMFLTAAAWWQMESELVYGLSDFLCQMHVILQDAARRFCTRPADTEMPRPGPDATEVFVYKPLLRIFGENITIILGGIFRTLGFVGSSIGMSMDPHCLIFSFCHAVPCDRSWDRPAFVHPRNGMGTHSILVRCLCAWTEDFMAILYARCSFRNSCICIYV